MLSKSSKSTSMIKLPMMIFRNSLIEKSYKIHNTVERIEVVTVRVAIRMHPRERYTQFAAWIFFSLYR